jgi:hypothetical protein
VPYNYPACGGVLWELNTPGEKRYRCHTGHSYTERSLFASQSEKIEEMLWISLRVLFVGGLLSSRRSGVADPSSRITPAEPLRHTPSARPPSHQPGRPRRGRGRLIHLFFDEAAFF